MADALCGPANPLQQFRKHTQVDRTLQQDRLVGPRQSLAEGFRTRDPRAAAAADAQLHAFENASPQPFQFQHPDFRPHVTTQFSQSPSLGPPMNWAADFQNLQISNHPLPVQQFRTEAPLVRSTTGAWGGEFLRQRSAASTTFSKGKEVAYEPSVAQSTMYQPSMSMYSQQPFYADSGMANDYSTQQQHQMESTAIQHDAQLSDADFEQAFQDAFTHLQEMDEPATSTEPLNQPQASQLDHKIGSDAINYVEKQDRSPEFNDRDADDLARTAGQLLNAVRHDTSTKFQNSQFLDLMRKIRDREVEVANNDLQMTSPSTTMQPGSVHEPVMTRIDQPPTNTHQHIMDPDKLRPHDPNTFEFPDMNDVYEPTTQVQALHPGGRMYPEQSKSPDLFDDRFTHQMSGGITAEDFERHVEENASLGVRFQR